MDPKELIVLVVLAVIVLALLVFTRKKNEGGRAAQLMKKYAALPPEQLATVPEEELVEAVVSHVLACAADSRRPDPVKVLAGKPQGFTVVYAVWAVCKEMAAGDYRGLLHTATRELTEQAGAGFTAIGATQTAAAWQTLCETEGDTAEAEKAFHLAVESECPLTLCVAYIRDNPEQFGGEPTEAAE
ncbi:MAG: hypothetical protein IJ518_02735 [Clostridia bacterium]|nr:hypothetical protein [Clostridia bacterium]